MGSDGLASWWWAIAAFAIIPVAVAPGEGTALIRAGVNTSDPSRLLPFIACVVAPGTKAVTTTARIFSHDIKVIEGAHAGCIGNVPTEAFKTEPRS